MRDYKLLLAGIILLLLLIIVGVIVVLVFFFYLSIRVFLGKNLYVPFLQPQHTEKGRLFTPYFTYITHHHQYQKKFSHRIYPSWWGRCKKSYSSPSHISTHSPSFQMSSSVMFPFSSYFTHLPSFLSST